MEANTISLKTFSTSLVIILFIETGLRLAINGKLAASLPVLGIIRCLESISLIVLASRFEGNPDAIGLSPSRILAGIMRGLLWSACFGIAAAVLFMALKASGTNALEFIHSSRPASYHHMIIFFLVGGVIGPIAEEVFFRGVIFGYFRKWGAIPATILSTLIFVATHPLGNVLPITQTVGGIVFAIAYEKEKNLLVPITIHCLGNLAIFSLAIVT